MGGPKAAAVAEGSVNPYAVGQKIVCTYMERTVATLYIFTCAW